MKNQGADFMKKFFAVIFVAIMLFSFSACGWKIEVANPEEEIAKSESGIKTESEPEQTESIEEILESYIKIENEKLSGKIHPEVLPSENSEETVLKDEFVSVSISVPEGWEPGTLEENGEIYGITFKLPWDNYHYASIAVYKDTGTTYDDLLARNSLWVGIDEYTYHEVSGNFEKGSYIRFDYPTSEKYDVEEDAVPVYGRFYQLQFDGYVVAVNAYIRIDSEENKAFDEKLCDEFISSIKIG